MKSALAIGFDWRPSRTISAAAAAVTLLAAASLFLVDLSPLIAATVATCVVALGYFTLRGYRQPRIARLVAGSDAWCLYDRDGKAIPADLRGYASLGAFLQLHLVTAHRHRYFVLAPDNSHADVRRRLRVLLARGVA